MIKIGLGDKNGKIVEGWEMQIFITPKIIKKKRDLVKWCFCRLHHRRLKKKYNNFWCNGVLEWEAKNNLYWCKK